MVIDYLVFLPHCEFPVETFLDFRRAGNTDNMRECENVVHQYCATLILLLFVIFVPKYYCAEGRHLTHCPDQ